MALKQFQDTAKANAITKIQNAIRNKKAIDVFATKYANKIIQEEKDKQIANDMEEQNKKRQKELYLKYNALYQPSNNLAFKPLIMNSNNIQKKQKISKKKVNNEIEIMRKKRLAAEHLIKHPLN